MQVAYFIKPFLSKPTLKEAQDYLGIVPASAFSSLTGGGTGGGVAISAGANSQSTGTVIFSNSNGITFGLNAGTLTASHNGITSQSNQAASASNGSFTFQTLNFSNANNVTFGTSAGGIITASVAPPGAASVNFSAGTTSNNLASVTFGDANGISFGLNAGTITGSHNALTSQSNAAASASNGSFTFQTLNFSNGSNVTFATSAGGIIAASVNAQSTQPVAASASNGSFLFSTLAFSNANNVTFGTSAGSIITASVVAGAAADAIRGIAAGASTATTNTVNFSNSNGISFGFGAAGNSTVITASHNALTSVAFSADASSTFQTLTFQNSNNVSFSNNAGAIRVTHNLAGTGTAVTGGASITLNSTGLSFNGTALAGTGTTFAGANISGSMTQNSAGLNLSLSVAAPGGAAPVSYFAPFPALILSQTMTVNQSTSHIFPFQIQCPLSFNFIRFLASGSVLAASTTRGTTANTTFSCGYTKSHNFAFYSNGTGASSQSLQLYFSTQVTEQYSQQVAAAGNSTQYSYTLRYSLPASNGVVGFTHDYSSSAASINYHSSQITGLTGMKQLDFSVATTLSAGAWWLMYGQSSNSASQLTSIGFRDIVTYNFLGISPSTLAIGSLGGATNSSVMLNRGNGSFTTVGGATTASLGFSNISSSASHNQAYVQFMAIV